MAKKSVGREEFRCTKRQEKFSGVDCFHGKYRVSQGGQHRRDNTATNMRVATQKRRRTVKICRRCRISTGDHNVRKRTKMQYHICKDCEDHLDRSSRIRKRMEVIKRLGGMCVCCKETRFEFLTIDHIEPLSPKRKDESKRIIEHIRRTNDIEKFQVLCYNCNNAKAHYGYCPCHEDLSRAVDRMLQQTLREPHL
jgi:hypothetical protein